MREKVAVVHYSTASKSAVAGNDSEDETVECGLEKMFFFERIQKKMLIC